MKSLKQFNSEAAKCNPKFKKGVCLNPSLSLITNACLILTFLICAMHRLFLAGHRLVMKNSKTGFKQFKDYSAMGAQAALIHRVNLRHDGTCSWRRLPWHFVGVVLRYCDSDYGDVIVTGKQADSRGKIIVRVGFHVYSFLTIGTMAFYVLSAMDWGLRIDNCRSPFPTVPTLLHLNLNMITTI